MVHHHGWILSDIEDMIPFEKDIYVTLINAEIEKRNLEIETANNR